MSYFGSGGLDFGVNLEDMDFAVSQRFIAAICKVFIESDYNAYFVCSLNTKNEIRNAETLSVNDDGIIDPKKFLSGKKLLLLMLSGNEEESTHILCTMKKFIIDINTVEYPFIVFSKYNYKTLREIVFAARRKLVAPSMMEFISDSRLSRFIDKHEETLDGLITVHDNYLTLFTKHIENNKLIELIEEIFQPYNE